MWSSMYTEWHAAVLSSNIYKCWGGGGVGLSCMNCIEKNFKKWFTVVEMDHSLDIIYDYVV